MDTIIHECEVLVPGVCDAKLLESFKRLHKTRHARGSARLLGAGDCFHACALFACATARARARDTHTHTHTHSLSLSPGFALRRSIWHEAEGADASRDIGQLCASEKNKVGVAGQENGILSPL